MVFLRNYIFSEIIHIKEVKEKLKSSKDMNSLIKFSGLMGTNRAIEIARKKGSSECSFWFSREEPAPLSDLQL